MTHKEEIRELVSRSTDSHHRRGYTCGYARSLLGIVSGLLFWSITLANSVSATDQSRKILFDRAQADISASESRYGFSGFEEIVLANGIGIALQTVVIPLTLDSSLPQVSFSSGERTLIGQIDLHVLQTDLTLDIPTADDERYSAVKPALAQLFENGWSPWTTANVKTSGDISYIEALISPFEIDSSGAVYLLSDLTFTTTGSKALEIGSPLTGSQAQEFLQSSHPAMMSVHANQRSTSDRVEYAIVTNTALQPEMERLAAYRRSTGRNTEVVLIEEVLPVFGGVDDAERLREYLRSRFATGVRYVLLAGDETIIPIRYAYYYNTSTPPPVENLMICDLYFADLNGDWDADNDGIWGEPTHDAPDLTPELYVGRLPISRIEQATNYVDKLILYETNPGFGDRSYLTRSAIFSSDQMRDFSGGGQHAVLANAMPSTVAVDTVGIVETPTGSDPAPANLNGEYSIDKLSSGYGIVNIIAHGRHDGFAVRTANYNTWPKSYILSTEEASGHGALDSLTQNGAVGLYVALSCDLGGFDMDSPPFTTTTPSFVESVISTKNSGAVAMIGYSRWGWVYSSYHMHREFLEQLYGPAEGNPVEAMYASAALYPYYRDLIYGQNYIGDPTVRIHLDVPKKYDLTLSTEDWANGTIQATVSHNGSPVSGIYVILSEDGEVLSDGLSGSDGNLEFLVELALGTKYTVAAIAERELTSLTQFTPSIVTGVEIVDEPSLPTAFALNQNFPNPFNPTTVISWDLPVSEEVELVVYDILGRKVDQVSFGKQAPGSHQFDWGLNTQSGEQLSSGVYLYQIRAGEYTLTRKMTALK